MTVLNRTRTLCFNLRGGLSFPTAVGDSNLVAKKTGSCTVAGVSGGGTQLALTATSEVQIATLYMADILPYPLAKLQRIRMLMSASADLPAAVKAAWGVASATNDDLDAVAAHAWFRLEGNNSVVCESDDGVTDQNDVATGVTLDTTPRWFGIDFETGIQRKAPPAVTLGHGSNVLFYAEQPRVNYLQVAKNSLFDLSGYTGNLQPFIRLQKATGTATGSLRIDELEIDYVC